MQSKKKCKCGSRDVVYVVQRGRSKKIDMYCEKCMPVEVDSTSGESEDGSTVAQDDVSQ